MKSRILSSVLALIMCCTTSLAYANTVAERPQINGQNNKYLNNSTSVAALIEGITGYVNTYNDFNEEIDCFVAESIGCDIMIPKNGHDVLSLKAIDHNIEMELPLEAKDASGTITDNGTVVYKSTWEDVSVAVQALSTEDGSNSFDAVRTMVVIENADAPRQYSFNFKLPKGYSLVEDYDYKEDDFDKYDCGAVYILDDNNRIISTIEPAWAKDASGENIPSKYEICGTTLIQHVDFGDREQFPIIADPTTHPTKTSKVYLTKTQVLEMARLYSNQKSSTWWNVAGCISGGATAYAKKTGMLVKITGRLETIGSVYLALSCYLTSMDLYFNAKESELNKFADKMKSGQYLRGINYQIWRNGGKNSGYYYKQGDYVIVNKKDA